MEELKAVRTDVEPMQNPFRIARNFGEITHTKGLEQQPAKSKH